MDWHSESPLGRLRAGFVGLLVGGPVEFAGPPGVPVGGWHAGQGERAERGGGQAGQAPSQRHRYRDASGPGTLDHPSLAELLPSGVFMANDDYNDRMVAIDPATAALVWQYGITGKPGTAPGELNTPDGFDLLLPDGSTPTHPVTG